ncbi:hypothetical protein PYW08_011205 [Mythimna loreyi]|uniref:Uncharacterized protein n=1 Tax=Mythimna loreyi TaxID=667449 RepID=A0ACC2Q3X9_9NEOP|nr:hypothetical protein PYW08_011205 [Mythimna loreyi]
MKLLFCFYVILLVAAVFAEINPICLQDKKVGNCRASIPSFFYNRKTRKCEGFTYGGCNGNDNRFGSKEECEAVCGASYSSNSSE